VYNFSGNGSANDSDELSASSSLTCGGIACYEAIDLNTVFGVDKRKAVKVKRLQLGHADFESFSSLPRYFGWKIHFDGSECEARFTLFESANNSLRQLFDWFILSDF